MIFAGASLHFWVIQLCVSIGHLLPTNKHPEPLHLPVLLGQGDITKQFSTTPA